VLASVQDIYEACEFDAEQCPELKGKDRFRLLPGQHGTDGYFLASLTPRRLDS
jgi:16S rRNA C967 or C1407 C5-methylase (RsmB/RsmF family)